VPLPRVERLTTGQRGVSALSIAAACGLWIANAVDVVSHTQTLTIWMPMALLAGTIAADFLSGLVHWGADTWGRDDVPVIGRRLLVPFRIHHINPDDFVTRPFLDTNGEVAMLAVPVLLAVRWIPLETNGGFGLAIAALGLCGAGGMTNQIHQWAHLEQPPRPIRVLQDCRLILGRAEHAGHHSRPYDASYCITTGWCNPFLDRIRFFRTMERIITTLTGAQPRQDDARYQTRFA
jgi:ubiquitin-conjugating enzyme E2 variant